MSCALVACHSADPAPQSAARASPSLTAPAPGGEDPPSAPRAVQSSSADGWTIEQVGQKLHVVSPERFELTISVRDDMPTAWHVVEANAIRLRLHRAPAPSDWTIYADGRQYLDGRWSGSWIKGDPMSLRYAAAHRQPADVMVPPEQGKLVRDTPGDANNDGYNERRGSYELRAETERIEARITPGTAPLARPVFEITGLPPGKIIAIADGALIDDMIREGDGRVLVEFPPGLISRTITLSVSSIGP